jgi:hypothetical protein
MPMQRLLARLACSAAGAPFQLRSLRSQGFIGLAGIHFCISKWVCPLIFFGSYLAVLCASTSHQATISHISSKAAKALVNPDCKAVSVATSGFPPSRQGLLIPAGGKSPTL